MDIQIFNQGSTIGFKPVSDAGRTWIDENLETEGWQWLGSILYIEARCADVILQGIENDGIVTNV